MRLDIRLPIGGMFALLGLLLAGYGLMTGGDEMYQRSLGVNINLWWGLALLIFGLLMLAFGLRAKSPRSQAPQAPDPT